MSRKSGDEFEYLITRYLIETYDYSFFDKYSETKYNKWSNLFEYIEPNFPLFLDEFASYDKIKLCKDSDGCIGNSSDIELHNEVEWVSISLKNNNLSIKHPRCSSMQNHISNKYKGVYAAKYKRINDTYYQLALKTNLSKFSDFSDEDKNNLYTQINNLLIETCKKSILTCKLIAKFCIGTTHTHQIIIKNQNNAITCMKYKPMIFDRAIIKNISYNTFILVVSNIALKFRIHTASSRITPTLSLKYDVTPVNADDLFNILDNLDS